MAKKEGKENPAVFISYSHDSPEHADKILTFSNRLRSEGIDTVLDQYEESPPEGWPMWMDRQIKAADFVLMICTEIYYKRVMGEEESGIGLGVKWEGNLIYQPIYNADTKNTKFIPVLVDGSKTDCIPTPMQGATHYKVETSQGYEELYRRLTHQPKTIKQKLGKLKRLPPLERKQDFFAVRTMLSKLPVTGRELFGRDEELKILDNAWADEKTKIISFMAWGGVGKTALVNEWLNRMGEKNWGGAERVYGWSFYSQGTTEDRQASSDTFLVKALEWFGDKDMAESSKSAWNKGVRLAELAREQKTLLILDGVEPLQYPPGPMKGRLKDAGLQALLRELSRGMNGLCVITTREKIEDIEGQVGHSVKLVELENLSPEAGMQVLRNTGVKGTNKELKDTSEEFGGHALALTLLGNFLAVVHNGEIRKKDSVPALMDDEKQGGHAKRVMKSYEIWLRGTAELDILYLMGLFDRPAEAGAIKKLREEPAIKMLTENIISLPEAKWKYAVEHLRELDLLAKEEKDRPDDLDCHPLIREHFGKKLKNERIEAWREGHRRLYEYYKDVPKKDFPDTLEEMEPLFRAVYHGCAAGKYQETLKDVYWKRICRGDEAFVNKQLGVFGSDLGAVACFFEKIWDRPAAGLSAHRKALVLNFAGFALRAVGRLRESAEPIEAGLKLQAGQKDWRNTAIAANNLSELYLMLGEVEKAVEYGQMCVEYVNKSGDELLQMAFKTALADSLYQTGEVEEAKRLFEEAEKMQKKYQPEYRYLYSLWGYRYCDLLLSLGEYKEVKERAEWSIEIAKRNRWLLEMALDKLSLGKAELEKVKSEKLKGKSAKECLSEAKKWLNEAVDGLRKAGQQDYLPWGLIVRAGYYRVTGEYKKAWGDLEEAREIAHRGEMKLYLAEYHLEAGRLCISQEVDAKEHVQKARELIETCGYHRRDKELKELEERLK